MKYTALIFALLVLVLGNNVAAQTDMPTAPTASRKDAAAAMGKLKMFVGTFNSSSKLSDEKTGNLVSEDTGKIVNRMRAGGMVFTIEKESVNTKGGKYDDIMAFQFDARSGKMRAFLFSNDPNPREIAVEIKDNVMILNYEPGVNIITRETITAEKDGNVRWLIEHKQADGSYRKTREIVATRQKEMKEVKQTN